MDGRKDIELPTKIMKKEGKVKVEKRFQIGNLPITEGEGKDGDNRLQSGGKIQQNIKKERKSREPCRRKERPVPSVNETILSRKAKQRGSELCRNGIQARRQLGLSGVGTPRFQKFFSAPGKNRRRKRKKEIIQI